MTESNLRWADMAVIILYFGALIACGRFFARKRNSSRDFLLGGGRIPGWAAGISIAATHISAVSLIALPGKAYETNWTFLLMLSTPLIAAPLVIRFVVPFFQGMRLVTAYEYLEMRFHLSLRLIASCNYALYELCRLGVLLLLPALVLTALTGWSLWISIVLMGVVTTIYTFEGGLEAVVWTDVIQAFIMLGGMVFAMGLVVYHVGGSFPHLLGDAIEQGRLKIFDFSPTLTQVTVFVFLLCLPTILNGYVAQQPTVQRILAMKDRKQAARCLWTTGISAPLILASFFATGTCLYIFYQFSPERLSPTIRNTDDVFIQFVIREMPIGAVGLLVSAIFAASMSSVSSSLSSLSSVIVNDFYKRLHPRATERGELRVGRAAVMALGLWATAFTLWLSRLNITSLFDFFIEFSSMILGSFAGVFLLGMLSRRTTTSGAWAGMVASLLAVLAAKFFTNVHFFVYAPIGTLTCLAVGFLVSLLWPSSSRSLEGLTWWTKARENEEGLAPACEG